LVADWIFLEGNFEQDKHTQGHPMIVEKDSFDRLPSESKEKAASKLRNGKLHYVSAVNSNVVYRSTSWILSKNKIGIFLAPLPYFVLLLGGRNPGGILGGMMLVLLLVLHLPYLSQCFRTIDYYGLPFRPSSEG